MSLRHWLMLEAVVPAPPAGGLTPELEALIEQTAEDAAYVRGRLEASVPGDSPVFFDASPPPPVGTARLDFFTRDFNVVAGVELDFIIEMEEERVVIIEGAMEYDQKQEVRTVDGAGSTDVYSSPVLQTKGYNPYYRIICRRRKFERRVWVPEGTSVALSLPHVPPSNP